MKMNHVALSVHDVEAGITHFATLGFVVEARGKHYSNGVPTAFINHPGTNMELELVQVSGQPAPGLLHIAFDVDDLQGKCDEMLALGYEYETPPFFNERNKTHMAFLRHPAGFIAQFNQSEK
jgi:catechol 2,3-dioxygenase-like lactoylglutathione lyase family enzyme